MWAPLESFADRDPYAAEQLLEQLPGGRDEPLACVVVALIATDPLHAERAAHGIAETSLRTGTLAGVVIAIIRRG